MFVTVEAGAAGADPHSFHHTLLTGFELVRIPF